MINAQSNARHPLFEIQNNDAFTHDAFTQTHFDTQTL